MKAELKMGAIRPRPTERAKASVTAGEPVSEEANAVQSVQDRSTTVHFLIGACDALGDRIVLFRSVPWNCNKLPQFMVLTCNTLSYFFKDGLGLSCTQPHNI